MTKHYSKAQLKQREKLAHSRVNPFAKLRSHGKTSPYEGINGGFMEQERGTAEDDYPPLLPLCRSLSS